MPIRIVSDYREIDRFLDRMSRLPDAKMVASLNSVFEAEFASASANVHVLTGALKGSGRSETSHNKGDWEGKMTWGEGDSGVDYAIYEKARDADHDWLLLTEKTIEGKLANAIRAGIVA